LHLHDDRLARHLWVNPSSVLVYSRHEIGRVREVVFLRDDGDPREGSVDLTGATISSATATLNAGKLDLAMGAVTHADDVNATVNAGAAAITLDNGARSVNLSLNAGSIQLCVPTGTALRATWAGTLGSNNFSASGLTKVDESTWTSAGFDASQPHTELHVTANAGSFELRIGGTCRA